MPDYTLINTAATPGSAFVSEQVGTVTINGVVYPVMLAASKIYTGAADANGGPVTAANPLFVSVTNLPGTQPVSGTVAISGTVPISGTVTATIGASEVHIGSIGGHLDNPTSVLTRPGDTTAYAQNDLIASSTTAGSVVVPSISVARVAAGSLAIRRLRLTTNKTSGFDVAQFRVRLWGAAPTYTNGDNGAYAVATGAAGFLGQFDVTLAQFGDGASGVGVPSVGSDVGVKLGSGQVIYWDMQYLSAGALTPASGQTFTLTAETYQN